MTENPYSPPESRSAGASEDLERVAPQSTTKLAKTGLLIFGGAPLVGFGVKIFFLIRAFAVLSQEVTASAAELADSISYALWFDTLGSFVGLVGAVMLCVAFRRGVRVPWIRTWTIGCACLWAFLLFPLGILVGLVVGIVAYRSGSGERGERRETPSV